MTALLRIISSALTFVAVAVMPYFLSASSAENFILSVSVIMLIAGVIRLGSDGVIVHNRVEPPVGKTSVTAFQFLLVNFVVSIVVYFLVLYIFSKNNAFVDLDFVLSGVLFSCYSLINFYFLAHGKIVSAVLSLPALIVFSVPILEVYTLFALIYLAFYILLLHKIWRSGVFLRVSSNLRFLPEGIFYQSSAGIFFLFIQNGLVLFSNVEGDELLILNVSVRSISLVLLFKSSLVLQLSSLRGDFDQVFYSLRRKFAFHAAVILFLIGAILVVSLGDYVGVAFFILLLFLLYSILVSYPYSLSLGKVDSRRAVALIFSAGTVLLVVYSIIYNILGFSLFGYIYDFIIISILTLLLVNFGYEHMKGK